MAGPAGQPPPRGAARHGAVLPGPRLPPAACLLKSDTSRTGAGARHARHGARARLPRPRHAPGEQPYPDRSHPENASGARSVHPGYPRANATLRAAAATTRPSGPACTEVTVRCSGSAPTGIANENRLASDPALTPSTVMCSGLTLIRDLFTLSLAVP